MEWFLAGLAIISAALFFYGDVMTVVQLCRNKLTIESLVFLSYQVLLFIGLLFLYVQWGLGSEFYTMAIIGMWVFIPQLQELAKGDESRLHKEIKDTDVWP